MANHTKILSLFIFSFMVYSVYSFTVDCGEDQEVPVYKSTLVNCTYNTPGNIIGLFWKYGNDSNEEPFIRIDNGQRSGSGLGEFNMTDDGHLIIYNMTESKAGMYTFLVLIEGVGNGQDEIDISLSVKPTPEPTSPKMIADNTTPGKPGNDSKAGIAVTLVLLIFGIIIVAVGCGIFFKYKHQSRYTSVPKDEENGALNLVSSNRPRPNGDNKLRDLERKLLASQTPVKDYLTKLKELLQNYSFSANCVIGSINRLAEKNLLIQDILLDAISTSLQQSAITDKEYIDEMTKAATKSLVTPTDYFTNFADSLSKLCDDAVNVKFKEEEEEVDLEVLLPDKRVVLPLTTYDVIRDRLRENYKEKQINWKKTESFLAICMKHVDKYKERERLSLLEIEYNGKRLEESLITEEDYLFSINAFHVLRLLVTKKYFEVLTDGAKRNTSGHVRINRTNFFKHFACIKWGEAIDCGVGVNALRKFLETKFITPDEYITNLPFMWDSKGVKSDYILEELKERRKKKQIEETEYLDGLILLTVKMGKEEEVDKVLEIDNFFSENLVTVEVLTSWTFQRLKNNTKHEVIFIFWLRSICVFKEKVAVNDFFDEVKTALLKKQITEKEASKILISWIHLEYRKKKKVPTATLR